jgi:hypothetical protein
MIEKIDRVKLLATRPGDYTIYVFQKMDNNEYIMCTRLPNWKVPSIDIGHIGFLQYQIVKAGDMYFDPNTQRNISYNYSNIYFINFVDENELVKNDKIIL